MPLPFPGSRPAAASWRLPVLALALALLVLPRVCGAAGVYRWVDEQGRVHYDDINRGGGVRVTRDLLKQRRVPDDPRWQGTIPAELVAEVRRRCDDARARQRSYRQAPEIYTRNEQGEVVPLSATESRQMLAEIRTEADYYCGEQAARRVYNDRRAEARAEAERRRRDGRP